VGEHTGRGCARQWQGGSWARGLLPAAAAGTALLVAACGGGPATAAGSTAYQTAFRKELAYAECMRANGVPGFPDPQGNGVFDTTIANRNDFHGPAFTSANSKCAHLQGHPQTQAQLQQSVTQALKYAACIRAHGVPNFSASVNGDQVRMGFQGGAAAANSTRSLIAQRICRPLLPNLLSGS
jgi:hypothetical protein